MSPASSIKLKFSSHNAARTIGAIRQNTSRVLVALEQRSMSANRTRAPQAALVRSLHPIAHNTTKGMGMKASVMRLVTTLRVIASFALLVCGTHWASAATTAASDDNSGLEEITVTAERFNATIQNTPISISALSGEQLTAAGLTRIEDIAHEIPGLSMRSAGPGLTEYEARGLASNGGAAPTVGFYLDEIPLSPPAVSQSGKVVIDPDLYDVQRVEVLRGPQGTLYGSGSMGGTVRVLTNEPKLNTYEGSVQATGSDTQGGSGNGSANLAMNLPIGETLAARVVLSYLYRSGWIDNITIHPFPIAFGVPAYTQPLNTLAVTNNYHNANNETQYGGRVSLLYKPSEDFSILGQA